MKPCVPCGSTVQVIQNAQALDKAKATPQEGCLFMCVPCLVPGAAPWCALLGPRVAPRVAHCARALPQNLPSLRHDQQPCRSHAHASPLGTVSPAAPTPPACRRTYSTLISKGRLAQLVAWVGGEAFDGPIVLDECHKGAACSYSFCVWPLQGRAWVLGCTPAVPFGKPWHAF